MGKTSSDSQRNSLPWVWNRIRKRVNSLQWDWYIINILIILVRMIALSLEPLFLYGLMINEYKKCVEIDRKLGITAIVSRSFLDISYLVLRFHTGFLGKQFRKYRRKLKNKLRADKKGAASRPTETMVSTDPIDSSHSTLVKDLRKYFLHQHLLFDILVFLPIPQVVMLCILLNVRAMKSLKTLQTLNVFIFFQYWPRVFQIYLPRKDLGSNHELLGERRWVLGPLDFFLYIIAGHVLGAFWYCFSIQRTVACWHMACENHGGCVRNSFYYCDHKFGYHSILDYFCPKNMPNAGPFDFGVFLDAYQSDILESKNIPQKIFYCFCWGMRNLSSFGSNLQISNDVWENCFVLCIAIFGLLLFLYYMGNFQIYLQRRITSKSIAKAAKRNEESINSWIQNKKLKPETSGEIIKIMQKKFHEEEDIYVATLISELPSELQRDVKYQICFNPLKNMSPTKHSASKKSSKRPRTDSENFRTIEADMAYNDWYKRATIIMERVVRMETLENTSIPEVFKERTWTKLLNPSGNVYAELIREFFANAIVEGGHINCWVRQKEFIITRDSIQEFLEVRPPFQQISIQYDDRLDSLEPMAELGGSLNKKSMNTIPFNVEMRKLAYIMIHNLYPVTNLTILSEPRTIFLYDLFTHKEIDICGHIYYLLTKSITKRNSRTILPFPSLIMGLIAKTKLEIPRGLTIIQRDYPIRAHTATRSKAHITRSRTIVSPIPRNDIEEKGGDTKEKIDKFTSAPEGSTQPSSQSQARGLDHLDRLIARVEQMYGMLESHVQHTTDQFTNVEGQITALSYQIKDMVMEQRQQQEGSDSESEQF